MMRICAIIGALLLALPVTSLVRGQGEKEKPQVQALPPHPLDDVFEKKTDRAMWDTLLESPHFKKAFDAAKKAKADQEERFRNNPNLRDATPAQAARRKFLEILSGDK